MIKVVWTNGCFDILHRGHFEMLEYAKSLGDYLVVGIDTDQKVKQDKGPARPYNNSEDRKFALKSTKYVDEVVKFSTAAQLEMIIKSVSPSIMVVGSDWKGKPIIGSQHVDKVEYFERIEGYSTTNILDGIKR
jgi:rfaE bifunctional protein nucleotidyltransferase chain/domain